MTAQGIGPIVETVTKSERRDDLPPFRVLNRSATVPVLLVCDHASRDLPSAYGTLGLEPTELWRHIAWDIGAADLTERLARRLGTTAVLGGVSRLLIDVNRPLDEASSIVTVSDGVTVTGNVDLDPVERARRVRHWFEPYHAEVARQLDRLAAGAAVPSLVSIHSFTPVIDGRERPWQIGVLWDEDDRIAAPLIDGLGAYPGLVVGDNEPYTGRTPFAYTVRRHGAARARPHVGIEVRQDLIDTHHGAEEWSGILADALARAVPCLGRSPVAGGERGWR